jgi:hypothetical protein
VVTESERRLVLHAVRLASLAGTEQLASRSGVSADVVAGVLDEARTRGLVVERTGRTAGWSLTAAGRAEGMRLLAAEVREHGARAAVEAAYRRFRTVNEHFLLVCTRWQLREVDGESVPNDHADPRHDAAVLAELVELHEVVVDHVTVPAGGALERFAAYPPRFDHALRRLRAGDLDWFTRPMIDSYHTVWFELHDDLLATLGLDRATERRAARAEAAGEPMHAGPPARGQTGGAGSTVGPAAEE